MNFLYNFFVTGTNPGDLAWNIASRFAKAFDIVGDVKKIAESLSTKLRALWNGFGGDFSWSDLGGAILDIGELLLTFAPQTKLYKIVDFLWYFANAL